MNLSTARAPGIISCRLPIAKETIRENPAWSFTPMEIDFSISRDSFVSCLLNSVWDSG